VRSQSLWSDIRALSDAAYERGPISGGEYEIIVAFPDARPQTIRVGPASMIAVAGRKPEDELYRHFIEITLRLFARRLAEDMCEVA
jgi:hypothetical protein